MPDAGPLPGKSFGFFDPPSRGGWNPIAGGSGRIRATLYSFGCGGIHMNVLLAGGAAILLVLAAGPAVGAAKTRSADDRFKALYTAEWKWREDQFANGEDNVREIVDHLPKVD